MARLIALLLAAVASASAARAEDGRAVRPAFHLDTRQLLSFLESRPPKAPDPLRGLIERVKKEAIGIRPFIMLVPTVPDETDDSPPPAFALIARVDGRKIISFTRPSTKTDPDDRLVFQRLVVSDLFEGRRFSLTVFEDHALSKSAAELLGVGARLTFRPALEVYGWRGRFEMYGSYDPGAGPSVYLGFSGRLDPPRLVTPLPLP